jgi:hypothetical protein
MRTARDEIVPRFKPRLKSESKVICERKAVAQERQQEHKQIADSAQIERLDSIPFRCTTE